MFKSLVKACFYACLGLSFILLFICMSAGVSSLSEVLIVIIGYPLLVFVSAILNPLTLFALFIFYLAKEARCCKKKCT